MKEMFKRDILKELEKWAGREPHKPLVLRGARQVGKTTVVHQFGTQFENYLYVNLEDEGVERLFNTSRPIAELLIDLFTYYNKPRTQGRTLLFIDEIQNSKSAVAKLRYFYEETPELYVIAAGSLLESLMDTHISFPVGRVEYMAMRPCSFREYLTAMGEELLRNHIEDNPSRSTMFHEKLMALFNRYALLGGMPEVISAYAVSGDIPSLSPIYDSLLQGYRDDVEKYARNRTQLEVIRHILQTGWGEAGKAITLGGFGGSAYKAREVGEAFRTLEKALLLELAYPTTHTSAPIQPEQKRAPKLLWLDVGLVNFAAEIQREVFGAQDILDAWRGMVAEQVVAQELLTLTHRVGMHRSFWMRSKAGASAEVDFVWNNDSTIIPIEVKSGNNAHLRSLHSFVNSSQQCTLAVRVWSQPFSVDCVTTNEGREFTLLNVPFYLVGYLPKLVTSVQPFNSTSLR